MVLTWLAGTTISAFGDAVWTVALAWTAVQTVSSTLAGVVLGAEMFPQAVLVLLGGVLADRFDPRRILVLGQVARALVLALGALAWHAGSDGAVTLFAIALSFGVVAGLTVPSGGPLLREFVHPDDFGTVMGWQQVLGRTMRLLGAPAGGVIVAVFGPVAAMVIDGASFAFIALVLA
jgi:MFS family permease